MDGRIVAAPMIRYDSWSGVGNAITGPAPKLEGRSPASLECELDEIYLPAGSHQFELVSLADRDGGRVRAVEVHARPAERPLFSFAMISDIHITDEGPAEWMNLKMGHQTAAALETTLADLAAEGITTILFGGDLTDRCRGGEFAAFGAICRGAGITGFACLGNHDLYDRNTAQAAVTHGLSDFFPGGRSSYVASLSELDLVVLDSESLFEKDVPTDSPINPNGLASTGGNNSAYQAPHRPIIVMRHYPLRNSGGLSSAGFELQDWSIRDEAEERAIEAVRSAAGSDRPVLYLNGHTHWTEALEADGGLHLQNPAFCEWPCCYRVFHIEPGAVRYELRQVKDHGFVEASLRADKRLTWMVSTRDRDRCGRWQAPRAPRRSLER